MREIIGLIHKQEEGERKREIIVLIHRQEEGEREMERSSPTYRARKEAKATHLRALLSAAARTTEEARHLLLPPPPSYTLRIPSPQYPPSPPSS